MADDADESQDGSETKPNASDERHRRDPRTRHEEANDRDRCRFDDFAMI